MTTIYLDHNATTPLDPAAREEMAACLGAAPGNPSSLHSVVSAVRLMRGGAR